MSKLILEYQYDASFFNPKPERIQDDFERLSVAVKINQFSAMLAVIRRVRAA
jgi:hypothetical protein